MSSAVLSSANVHDLEALAGGSPWWANTVHHVITSPSHRTSVLEVGGQAVLGRQLIKATPWLTERNGYDPPSCRSWTFADDSTADDIEGILKELSEYIEHDV